MKTQIKTINWPTKQGQIVRFHTPFADENPNQIFIVNEIFFDVEKPRAIIKTIGGTFGWSLTSSVSVEDLELVPYNNSDLIGQNANIEKGKLSFSGKILQIINPEEPIEFEKNPNQITTNLEVVILDNNNIRHQGRLIFTEDFLNEYSLMMA
jgi:hypothetical protein